MTGKEARQASCTGLDALTGQFLTQLAQEDLRSLLVGRQDQVRVGLSAMRAVVAPQRLGGEVPLLLEAR